MIRAVSSLFFASQRTHFIRMLRISVIRIHSPEHECIIFKWQQWTRVKIANLDKNQCWAMDALQTAIISFIFVGKRPDWVPDWRSLFDRCCSGSPVYSSALNTMTPSTTCRHTWCHAARPKFPKKKSESTRSLPTSTTAGQRKRNAIRPRRPAFFPIHWVI